MVDDSEGDTPAGEYGNGYDISDAKADTQDTYSNIREAWHDARDTAAEEGGWGVPLTAMVQMTVASDFSCYGVIGRSSARSHHSHESKDSKIPYIVGYLARRSV
jgi:hypothetical protein